MTRTSPKPDACREEGESVGARPDGPGSREPSPAVSALTGFDPSRDGILGETPILWRFKMQYAWNDQLADEHPDWDQCCTCAVFAVSETRARQLVWEKFKYPNSVMPQSIHSCIAERYQNERDREIDRQWGQSDGKVGAL